MKRVKNYSNVALIYSHLMRSIDYKMWAKYIYSLSRISKKRNCSALELACGSGIIADYIKGKFQNYTMCDLSLEMLKSIEAETAFKINCDFQNLPFKNKYDFVFSTFDSVNYLLTKKKFITMLNNVEQVLKPSGIFTFDVSLEANSLHNHKYLNRKGEYLGIKYEQLSNYNEMNKIHTNKFVIRESNNIKVKEIHKQRIYSFNDYFKMISKTNLFVYACYDSFSFNNASGSNERAQFVLRKRN